MNKKSKILSKSLFVLYCFLFFLSISLLAYALFLFFYQPHHYYENKASSVQHLSLNATPISLIKNTPAISNPIFINEATLEELLTLPSIGPVTAQNILNFRNSDGPFHFPEDLLFVKGIGENTLNKIAPYLLFR